MNNNPISPQVFFGPADHDGDRPDIAAIFGEQFHFSGYSIQVPAQAAGNYQVVVYMHSKISNSWAALTRNIAVGTAQTVAPATRAPNSTGEVPAPVAGPGTTQPVLPPAQPPVAAPPAPQATPGKSL